MNTELGCAHVTPAGRNVFADLGFAADEAVELKRRSEAIIEADLALERQRMGEATPHPV